MTADSPILGRDLFSKATYEGPAYMTTYMSALQEGQKVESRLLVSHLPLTLTSFEINFGVMVKKIPGMTAEEEHEYVQGYIDANNFAFGQKQSYLHQYILGHTHAPLQLSCQVFFLP